MRPPIFVRPFTDAERQAVAAGLRSSGAFVLRRCQILLASARGERAPRIALQLGCDDQTVLDALHAFNASRLACLQKKSIRAHRTSLDFASFQPSARRPAPNKNVPDSAKKVGVRCPGGIPLCMRC